ncbi:YqaJ viral recombinase family protein [Bradyrhizobium sp. Tv2a-2]|uniref:YqaJ viral recombinase family protein n=1 Tax=Bradyrhizobium sp. Tv2a-2 TaxID=113395 RepID=UPI0004108634|nr:YqaJ viral recombinase family protein [Bradyrhizobium sp. Tv2a-2]
MSEVDSFRSIGDVAMGIVRELSLGDVEIHKVDPVRDREGWLKLRQKDVTASDVASIAGVGYRSPREVWADKTGQIGQKADTPVLRRGRRFEPSLWATIKEENPSWEIRAGKVYLRAPSLRFGATPDAMAIDPERPGLILIQGKVVAKPVFVADWLGGDREGTNPIVPLGYQLQTLAETMLASIAFKQVIHPYVAAWVIDTFSEDLKMIPLVRHPVAEQKILETVKGFWDLLDAGGVPAIDPTRDHDLVRKLYPVDDGSIIDLSSDNLLPDLFDERKKLGEVISSSEKRRDEISTEIMAKIGAATFALIAGGRKLSLKVTNVKEQQRAAYSFRSLREVKVK